MIRLFFAVALVCLVTGCSLIQPIQPRTNIRDVVVDEAMSQLDRPYRYGGSDPTGFDNAGLVYFVFSRAGVEIPRIAGEQEASGHKVSFAKMRPGDLIFYSLGNHDRSELHVGIYTGDGRMVHITKDGQVTLETIAGNPFWQRRYADSVSLLP